MFINDCYFSSVVKCSMSKLLFQRSPLGLPFRTARADRRVPSFPSHASGHPRLRPSLVVGLLDIRIEHFPRASKEFG